MQIFKFWTRALPYLAIGVLCIVGVFLAARPALPQQPITLKLLMTSPDVPPWTQFMVKEFEAAHPNIRLQIVEGPTQVNLLEDMYTTAFLLGNSPYDLVNMDVIWTPKFAAAGWLMDLTDDISEAELAAFSPADVEGSKYAGRLYRLPVRSDAGMLYYRKDLLDAAGFEPPRTFEDIARISQALQAQKTVRWGYLWQGKQYEGVAAMFVEMLKGFGGFWVNPDTLEVGLDRPEALKAIAFLQNTIRQNVSPPGVTTYVEEDIRRIFQSGDAAFMRNWPYAWSLMNTDSSPVQGKIAIMPMVGSETTQERGSCLGGWGLGIAKTSKHKQAALEAIRFITSEAAQKRFILNAGYVPSRRNLFNDSQVVDRYSHYPQLLDVVDKAVLRPPIAQYAQASEILQRYLSAALTNQQTPESAMQQAAGETRRLLETGRRGVGSS